MTFKEQEAYLASMKQKWDLENSIDLATAKGEAKKAIEIAQRMLTEGLPLDVIARCSGLSEEQVRALMQSLL